MPRPRTPKKILELTGSRHAADRADPAPFTDGRPTCPEFLSAEAKREWKRVCDDLEHLGLLKLVDRAMLSVYCESWATFVKLSRDIATEGEAVAGSTGSRVLNPKCRAAHMAYERMRQIATQYGFTAISREKLSPPDQGDGKPKVASRPKFGG